MDCDASIYGEGLFIFITEKANKYFLKMVDQMWASNAKDEFNANMFTNGSLEELNL